LALLIDIDQWLRRHDQPDIASRWITQVYPQMTGLTASLQPQIANLPTTYDGIFARINFARSLVLQAERERQLGKSEHIINDRGEKIASLVLQSVSRNRYLTVADQLLHDALSQAKALHSIQAEAYAAGTLGWLHEQRGQWKEALTWTRQALKLASRNQASDLVYQWAWQTGRLLKQQGHVDQAITAYNRAITALQATRDDLIAVNPDAQFSLRDSVEPVYRELIDLLLPVGSTPSQAALERAVGLVDLLQLTELEDFLRCRLAVAGAVRVDQVNDPTAAIFYPIILRDRLEVILQMPNQPLQRHTVAIEQKPLEQLLGQVRRDLVLKPRDEAFDEQAQQQRSGQVYDWLIRPVQATLVKHSIKTLVFASDGALRNIPIAALYDSQQQSYLIDQYAIAVTPGLKILGAKRYSRDQLRALIAGLTTTSRINLTIQGKPIGFVPLENVSLEVTAIQKLLPKSEVLRGQDFTAVNVRNRLNSAFYPIVHLASHGNFSSEPQATFILTDSGPPITIDELQRVLKDGQQAKPDTIELLIFSACKTAVGDRRATLGFAGAALRAGANSTLASLWAVNDRSTALIMEHFYQALIQSSQPITKAEALRIAQRSLRQDNPDYKLPYYWAPFVLVGNWL
jgi:CHAT domain-containing protein